MSPLLFNLYVTKCNVSPVAVRLLSSRTIWPYTLDPLISRTHSEGLRDRRTNSQFELTRCLSVSPTKSALIVLSKKRISSLNFAIVLEGITVNLSHSYKFLGVLLDPILRGREHTRYLADKCGKLANILKSLCGIWSEPKDPLLCIQGLGARID